MSIITPVKEKENPEIPSIAERRAEAYEKLRFKKNVTDNEWLHNLCVLKIGQLLDNARADITLERQAAQKFQRRA